MLVPTRVELAAPAVVAHDDCRAGVEADLKGEKRGLGLGVLRKHKLAAQTMVVLLGALADVLVVEGNVAVDPLSLARTRWVARDGVVVAAGGLLPPGVDGWRPSHGSE
ncbi:MAG: hypothetical protein HY332_05695 [Chloroflexi bacterium]|nr:hypothetical protein [Chloroflexota bacterium]